MKKLLPFIILITALAVSGSAAFYSVFGLGKLFAGAAVQVMIMTSTLEVAKLVIATALHRYWKGLHILFKSYLIIALISLVGITSAGIYGFLSSAYQITATKDALVTKQIDILELKKERFDEYRTEHRDEKSQVVSSITELRKSLSNPNQVQYIDKESGQLVTTTSSSARRSLETQLKDATSRRDKISLNIEAVTDSLTSLDVAIIEAEASSESTSELGPLKYLAGLTGKPMDVVVNWFLFLLIFVFDPLAITLILLANYAFERVYGKHVMDTIVTNTEKNNVPLEDVLEHTPTVTIKEVKEIVDTEDDVEIEKVDEDIVMVKKVDDDIDVVYDDDVIKRNIVETDLDSNVARHIYDALPWLKINKKKKPVEKKVEKKEELSDRQKANMTHQEIENWIKTNM